ncbi:TOMM precursor leader peptide-binding protein [Sorangium sp. So ce854]|uniref:TOMM precursor leader peptide-binding protein n=1 Tax=Sorangium sp. So ce854 TaxID=3133322 RepID=UPI003F62461E
MAIQLPSAITTAPSLEGTAPSAPAEAHERLERARVLVVGLEPWGAVAATDLASAGVGALHVLDDREVTVDDLGPFAEEDLGNGRAQSLLLALSRIAPGCAVTLGALRATADHPLIEEDTGWDLILTCVSGDDLFVLQSVARFADAASILSLSAHLDGLEAVIGPAVVPGETACWDCCRLRRLATSDRPEADHALQASLLAARPGRRARTYLAPTAALLGHAVALAAIDLLENRAASRLAGHFVVQNLVGLEASSHAVLQMPWCEVCGGAAGALREGRARRGPHRGPRRGSSARLRDARDPAALRRMLAGVVDARAGIVKHLWLGLPSPALAPETPLIATALLSNTTDGSGPAHHCDEPQVGTGKGTAAVDALIRATGEAIERYAAGIFDEQGLLRAPVADMKGDFIAPERLCLYSEEQYARPGFPYDRLDPTTPIEWTVGRWLDTRAPVVVPALPTYYGNCAGPGAYFCQVTSNGLAAGPTLEAASMGAALELIERDAFMISWLARRPGRRILPDDAVDPGAHEIARQLAQRGARIELYLLDAGIAVPVVMCVGYGDGKRWPGAVVSIAAHLSPLTAIRKAVLEQGQIVNYVFRMMTGEQLAIPERPEDVRTLEDHAIYYVPPSRAAAFSFLRNGGTVTASELEEPEEVTLSELARRVQAAGMRIAIVDVTSPDLAATPFRVARALGPDFQQIHFGHELARLGNPRLHAMAPRGLNPDPHPMA